MEDLLWFSWWVRWPKLKVAGHIIYTVRSRAKFTHTCLDLFRLLHNSGAQGMALSTMVGSLHWSHVPPGYPNLDNHSSRLTFQLVANCVKLIIKLITTDKFHSLCRVQDAQGVPENSLSHSLSILKYISHVMSMRSCVLLSPTDKRPCSLEHTDKDHPTIVIVRRPHL